MLEKIDRVARTCTNVLLVFLLLQVNVLAFVRLPFPEEVRCDVAVDFAGTNNSIAFSAPAARNLTNKTVTAWVNIDSFVSVNWDSVVVLYGSSNEYWGMFIVDSSGSGGSLLYFQDFSGTDGIWETADGTLTTGKHFIAITYNNSATANDPVLYIDGSPVAVSVEQSPTGSYVSGATTSLFVGAERAAVNAMDGRISDVRIYNRILTAAEIAELYSGRGGAKNDYGLVFHAPCVSAAGLQTFDGTTLTANTNYVYDRISGAQGNPSGNPVGRADVISTFIDDH